jgi:molecular chaperone DnaJ
MNKKDYYETLGVTKESTPSEIKKAYRNLAKKYHPDNNKDEDASLRFSEISEAYEVLSDESKKKAYDQFGHAGTQGFSGGAQDFGFGDQPFDMGDIFSQFFGGSMGGNGAGFDFGSFGGQRRSGPRPSSESGASLRYRINISFIEAMEGGEYEIKVQRDVECDQCDGTGSENKKTEKCSTCNGKGQVQRIQQSILGRMAVLTECPDCKGYGQKPEKPCSKCHTSGLQQEEQPVKIRVPAGAFDGMTLRFSESGSMGRNGGGAGDLYIEIGVELHETFERNGNDIYDSIDISVDTAVLGDEIMVETVLGPVKLKIPSGTQPGSVFRIKDKGAPIIGREGQRGDHYVRVDILIPKKLNKKQKKAWEELRSLG